jgi:4-hydroxy-tetrahydrodipicolinate synthase
MTTFKPGLVHTPVTPFSPNGRIDYDTYGKLIEFHLGHGAESLALPMHAGESVSLTDAERRDLLEFALKQVKGRVPLIAHASQSGTDIATALARHAARAGAAAVVAATPYYWTPPTGMLLEHFTQIGRGAGIPFFIYNSPGEMGGVKVTTDLVLKLIDKIENFAGVIDASLDWQFMIEVLSNTRQARPDFQLLTGVEYLISAGAIGAEGMLSSLAGIAPVAVRALWDLCLKERYEEARLIQEALAALRQAVKPAGVAGLKGGLRTMMRECGQPRPPVDPLSAEDQEKLAVKIGSIDALREEPRGWVNVLS